MCQFLVEFIAQRKYRCLERRIFRASASEEGQHATASGDRKLVVNVGLPSGIVFSKHSHGRTLVRIVDTWNKDGNA